MGQRSFHIVPYFEECSSNVVLIGNLVILGDEGHFTEILLIWRPNENEQICQIVKETKEWLVDGDFFLFKGSELNCLLL